MENTDELNCTRRRVLHGAVVGGLSVSGIGTVAAQNRGNNENDRYDEDDNGFPDEDVEVTGMYKALVAYDANGNQYQRNPSGRGLEYGSLDDLDPETTTKCYYKVQYRGTFGNDPYMDTGWVKNEVVCKGYEPDNRTILWVHESDPRYTGDGKPAFGGDWEVHVDSQRGLGNVLVTDKTRPQSHS